ncbi:MAG: AglZ/HisF2 family acetamidino modification protein [Gemmatimonadaceae bacterium]
MLRPRITPCLLVHRRGLVKTVQFKSPKYVGDPINAVKIFNEKEADELIVVDIDATVDGVEPDFTMIRQLAVECRMPLCYGGGVKTAAQAKRIVALGVEKVAVSAAAVDNPALISQMAQEVGSQSVVVVLDVRKTSKAAGYEVCTHNGKRATGKSPLQLAADAEARGAGEIVINSIDRDGQMKGYDLELAAMIRKATRLPMTVLGGAGSLADVDELIRTLGVMGAAAGSMFVFKGTYRAVLINYPNHAQKEALIGAALSH